MTEKIAPEFADIAPPDADPKKEAIIKMRQEGKSYRTIKKELKVSQATIADTLAEAGLLGVSSRKEESRPTLLFESEDLKQIIAFPFNFFAERYGDFWKLSPEQENHLTGLTNKVASKYLPLWLEKYADEFALTMTLGMLIYPRWVKTKDLIKKQKEEPIPETKPSQPSV